MTISTTVQYDINQLAEQSRALYDALKRHGFSDHEDRMAILLAKVRAL